MIDTKLARTIRPLTFTGTVAVFAANESGQIVDTGERIKVKNAIRNNSGRIIPIRANRFVAVISVLGEWQAVFAEC